jgi:hypothetical protein
VQDDAGAVDDRLQTAPGESVERAAEVALDLIERRDFFGPTERSEMLPNDLADKRPREIEIGEPLEQFADGRDGAAGRGIARARRTASPDPLRRRH